MRFRGSLILLALALLLLGYYIFVERPRQRPTGDSFARETLITISPDDVDRLGIERPAGRLEFTIVDTHWEMTHPLRDLADQSSVMTLLATVVNAEIERNIGPQDDISPYGLDDPVVVTLSGRDSAFVSVELGGYTVDHSYAYGRLAGSDDVLLLPTSLIRYATADIGNFRNHRVVDFDIGVVTAFSIHAPAGVQEWTRRSSSDWFTIVSSDTIDGNPAAVAGVLRRLRGLRVKSFPDEEHAPRVSLLGEHSVSIAKAGPPVVVSVMPFGGAVFAQLRPQDRVVEVDSTVMEIFSMTVDELRQKHLLRFNPSLVARIELSSSDTMATIIRAGEVWTYPNPSLGDISTAAVNRLLGAMSALEWDVVVNENAPGDDAIALGGEPTFTLAVWDVDGTILDELRCRQAGGVARATSTSSGIVTEMAPSKLRALQGHFHRLHRRR